MPRKTRIELHRKLLNCREEESGRSLGNPIVMRNTGTEDYAWAQWTPSETGSYTLYLKLVEPYDDTVPGNDTATLQVTVQDTASGGSGDSGGCFINSLNPG